MTMTDYVQQVRDKAYAELIDSAGAPQHDPAQHAVSTWRTEWTGPEESQAVTHPLTLAELAQECESRLASGSGSENTVEIPAETAAVIATLLQELSVRLAPNSPARFTGQGAQLSRVAFDLADYLRELPLDASTL
jgi:hypothetical protein